MKTYKYSSAAFVAILTFIIYLPALQNGFVNWDDNNFVYANPYIQTIDVESLIWMLTTFNTADWFPLTWMSHALDYKFWKLNPMGHHLTSAVFHSINTFLVIILTVRLIETVKSSHKSGISSIIAGTVTGILFGLHPLHVESVAWVSERKDVLYSFFFILGIFAYLRYASLAEKASDSHRQQPAENQVRWKYYALCILFFILSIMSKPMAITFPIILIILDFYPLERVDFSFSRVGKSQMPSGQKLIKVIIEKLPFFILSIASAIITIISNQVEGAIQSLTDHSLAERLFVACKALAFYPARLVWPSNLAPFYPYPTDISFSSITFIISFVFVTSASVASIYAWKKQKVWLAVWSLYIVTLLPVLGIVQSGAQAAADRYSYLSTLGFFLLAGLGISSLWARTCASRHNTSVKKTSIVILSILVISILSILTINQTKIWRDSITLWNHELQLFNAPTPYLNRGLAYAEKGQLDYAIRDFSSTISLDPNNAAAYSNRGIAYIMMNNSSAALNDFNTSISLDPNIPTVYFNRGLILLNFSNYQKAISDFMVVVKHNPEDSQAYYNRGIAYQRLGKHELAVKDFRAAAKMGHKKAQDYLRSTGQS